MGVFGDPVIWVVPGVPCTRGAVEVDVAQVCTRYGLSRSCSSSFQMGRVFKEFNGTSGSNRNPMNGGLN